MQTAIKITLLCVVLTIMGIITTSEFKESAINWIERNKDNSLLKSLI